LYLLCILQLDLLQYSGPTYIATTRGFRRGYKECVSSLRSSGHRWLSPVSTIRQLRRYQEPYRHITCVKRIQHVEEGQHETYRHDLRCCVLRFCNKLRATLFYSLSSVTYAFSTIDWPRDQYPFARTRIHCPRKRILEGEQMVLCHIEEMGVSRYEIGGNRQCNQLERCEVGRERSAGGVATRSARPEYRH
jgi:hypothetical protein